MDISFWICQHCVAALRAVKIVAYRDITTMDTTDRQLAVALQEMIQSYETVLEIETGDEEADDEYRHGVQTVLSDIKSLLNDAGDGFNIYKSERPFIPIGFRLHSVTH